MLQEIRITNFAIIENLAIEFHAGLNVLTGETGAGKSILVEAVGPQTMLHLGHAAAFAAGDWDRAWSLTSCEFRAAGIDAGGLREIVTTGYPAAADAADHEVVGCLFAQGEAQEGSQDFFLQRFAVILDGEGSPKLRDMESGEQREVELGEVIAALGGGPEAGS